MHILYHACGLPDVVKNGVEYIIHAVLSKSHKHTHTAYSAYLFI